jgi:hypothetical protein
MSVVVSEGGSGRTTEERQLVLIGAASSPQLVWRDPPPDRRHRVLTAEIVEQLRANLGRWAVVREYPNRTAVKGRRLLVKHPVDVELRGVVEPPGSVLYARAKPPQTLNGRGGSRGQGDGR